MNIEELRYDEIYPSIKKSLDLTLTFAEYKLSVGLRDFKVMEYYKQWSNILEGQIDNFKYVTPYFVDIPQFKNTETTKEELDKWGDDNEVCTFYGMWDFFGYRIPVYIDDYGQQYYIKFEDKESGKVVELSNGAFNVFPYDVAYQVMDYIKRDYIHQLKEIVNKNTNFNIEGLIELDKKGEFI